MIYSGRDNGVEFLLRIGSARQKTVREMSVCQQVVFPTFRIHASLHEDNSAILDTFFFKGVYHLFFPPPFLGFLPSKKVDCSAVSRSGRMGT